MAKPALVPPYPGMQLERLELVSGATLYRIHPHCVGPAHSSSKPTATTKHCTIRGCTHSKITGVMANPSTGGDARFSPIFTPTTAVIPTLYAASTFRGAAMETAFHNVPYSKTIKPVPKRFLEHLDLSEIMVAAPLNLANLSFTSLRALGPSPETLIHSNPSKYAFSRQWAEAIYREHSDIQGLTWPSRQDSDAQTYVFFGDRLPPNTFVLAKNSELIRDNFIALQSVAKKIGVALI